MGTTPGSRQASTGLSASFILVMAFGALPAVCTDKPYQYYVVGNPADVVLTRPGAPSMALMGGGPDVDAAFKWMIEKSGGGNFVVLRARGSDAYNPYIYAMGGTSSVETIVIPSREAAHDPFVRTRIEGAEALFIAGGDQSDYINYWKGTPVETAIQHLARQNIPIGGASAGLAIMGQYAFATLNGTINSPTALSNPFHPLLTIERSYLALPYMNDLIADPHMATRDRMGRLITFMARIVHSNWSSLARGIGVDVATALLVDNGIAFRVGAGSAYFLQTAGRPDVCEISTPLTYKNLDVQRLSGAGTFNMHSWSSHDGGTINYSISAINGALSSTQAGGAIY